MLLLSIETELKLLIDFNNPELTVDFFHGCAQKKKKL